MRRKPVVLLACGSFNPPTPMHFRMFEIARDQLNSSDSVNIIGGIVSPVHDAYGKKDLVSATHRYSMLQLALKSSNWIKISNWEITRDGWTKTRYSLQYHQNYINAYIATNGSIDPTPPHWLPQEVINISQNNVGIDETDGTAMKSGINNGNEGEGVFSREKVQVKLLCGADLLESFATPGLWAEEDIATILNDHGLVVITRNGSNPEKFIYDSDILTQYKKNINIITNWVPNEVSSTMIRRLLKRGESVKYLIDDNIISYIKMNQLFGSGDVKIKYLTTSNYVQPCIDTPSPNDIVMKSPSEFRIQKDEEIFKSRGTNISTKIMNYFIGVDEIDKNDVYTSSNQSSTVHFKEKRSRLTNKVSASNELPPKSFCGDNDHGSTDSLENMHILPRKSVKVITDVSGVHKIVNSKRKVCGNNLDITDDVFVFINSKMVNLDTDRTKIIETIENQLHIDVKQLQINDSSNRESPKSSSPRSYDEVVKFIFSEHGIQVISDKETIV